MKVILGSGIVGLLAKIILGDEWQIIPFGKSRFFSWNPVLDDNFIIRDERIDHFLGTLGGHTFDMYRVFYSLGGELLKQHNAGVVDAWLDKAFHRDPPPQAAPVMRSRSNFWIYNLRVGKLYQSLVEKFKDTLVAEAGKGRVTEIGANHLIRGGQRIEFDQAVSTIPLPALLNLIGKPELAPVSKPVYYYHIRTDALDFEGGNQALVVDPLISFYKVTNIYPGRYLFYCHEDIPTPGQYFMAFMDRFEIIEGTVIADAMPIGNQPTATLESLEQRNIHCVGSYAEWDWCRDVGSCILRLLKVAGKVT